MWTLAQNSVTTGSMLPALPACTNAVSVFWQQKCLFQTDGNQLTRQACDKDFEFTEIYDMDVIRLLRKQYHRVHSMMFVGTIVTNEQGIPKQNLKTGLIVKEDDLDEIPGLSEA